MPSEIAQITGMKMLDVPPIRTCATITGQNLGKNAMRSAPNASATTPAATSARLDLTRSTSAPAGVWQIMPAMPPIVRASPTCSLFHLKPAR